jgi:hypothetical protein
MPSTTIVRPTCYTLSIMGRQRIKHVQLTLDQARRPDPGHGGWRPGAGRKHGRKDVAHTAREAVDARFPQHITLRVVPGVSLRKEWLLPTIHGAIRDSQREGFRVVEFNDLGNHFHFVVEAADAEALASGMNGLEVRLARRLNRKLKRRGKLFVGRYHARPLRTPTEVRNALRYVLLNARHHAADRGETLSPDWFDPFSSAPWFKGWSRPLAGTHWLQDEIRSRQSPTAPAKTWLLADGWQLNGPLALDDVPVGRPRRTMTQVDEVRGRVRRSGDRMEPPGRR